MKTIISPVQALFLALTTATALAQTPSTNAPRPRPAPPAGLRVGGTNEAVATVGTNLTNRPAKSRLPFQGTVKSTDATAMTVTLTGAKDQDRIVHMDGESRLIKGGKPATIADVVAADYARGLLKRNDRGEEVIVHATFGPKPTPKPKTTAKPKNPAPTTGAAPAGTGLRPAPAPTTPTTPR